LESDIAPGSAALSPTSETTNRPSAPQAAAQADGVPIKPPWPSVADAPPSNATPGRFAAEPRPNRFPSDPSPGMAAPTATPDLPRLPDDTVQMPRQVAEALPAGAPPASGILEERTVTLPLVRPPTPRLRYRLSAFMRSVDQRTLPPVGRALTNVGRRALLRRVVASVIAITCVALLVLAVFVATRPSSHRTTVVQGVAVGVREGDSISAYKAKAQVELHAAVQLAKRGGDPTERYALVSFADYYRPDEVAALLGGVRAAQVFMRVRSAGVRAPIVWADVDSIPDDIVKAMRAEAGDKLRDVADLDRMGVLASQVSDNQADQDAVREQYKQQRRVANAEAAAYQSQSLCRCVFAVVVHASVGQLDVLNGRDGVRVVDLVPVTTNLDHDTFMPPVPDQKGNADPPPMVALTAP